MNLTKRFNHIIITGRPFLRWNSTRLIPLVPLAAPSTSQQSSMFLKLRSVLPRITDKAEFKEAKELISQLEKFESGIYMDSKASKKLILIVKNAKGKSSVFKELIKISKLRLLRILFTNKEFWSSFYLLQKDGEGHIFYPNQVPPPIVAGILINLMKLTELKRYMLLVLKDDELSMEVKTKFTRSIVKNFMYKDSIGYALEFWYKYSMLAYGHLNFDNIVRYSDALSSLYLILNQYNDSLLIPSLVKFKNLHNISNHHFSMFLSSCIYSLGGNVQNMNRMLSLWDYKASQNLEYVPSDLTAIMAILNKNKENDRALKLYNRNPRLHEDAQFDSLLRIHGSEKLWKSMQEQFEDLFGRGELPNINHYGIVMIALASKGEIKAVTMLWNQLLSRKMIPSIPVLHSMMLANANIGNYRGTILWFQKMPNYGVSYTKQSYNFLFKALRGLKEIKVQLKFFKRLVYEDRFELDRGSFREILMTCLELNDVHTAKYVYRTLETFGYKLDDKTEAILLNIFNNTKNFNIVEKKIESLVDKGSPISPKLYNQLMLRYLKTNDFESVFEIVSKMREEKIPLDDHSYSYLITALVKSDNFEQAFQLFNDLSPQFTLYQYNELMHTLYDSPHYHRISEVYDKMIEMELTPNLESYQCLIKGLCKQYEVGNEDPEYSVELAVKVVNTLLKDKAKGDLNTPLVNLPFSLVYKLLNLLISYDFALCKVLLVDFYESSQDKLSLETDVRFNYISMKIYERERNDDEFLQLFGRFTDLLKTKFFITPSTEKVNVQKTPFSLRLGLSDFWPNLLRIKRERHELVQVQPLVNSLIHKGFAISNKNYNQIALALLRSKETYETALELIENKLIKGYIYLRRKRKHNRLLERAGVTISNDSTAFKMDKFKYYFEGMSYIKMVQIIDKKILPTKSRRKQQRDETLAKLMKKYPKTLKFFHFRAPVVSKWFVLNMKFKGTKRKRFANQRERDAYRHQRRMEGKLEGQRKKWEQRKLGRILFQNRGQRNRRSERFGFKPKRLGIDRKKLARLQELEIAEREAATAAAVDGEIPSPFVSKVGDLMNQFEV